LFGDAGGVTESDPPHAARASNVRRMEARELKKLVLFMTAPILRRNHVDAIHIAESRWCWLHHNYGGVMVASIVKTRGTDV
jgi:hypothetical protein